MYALNICVGLLIKNVWSGVLMILQDKEYNAQKNLLYQLRYIGAKNVMYQFMKDVVRHVVGKESISQLIFGQYFQKKKYCLRFF